MSQYELTLSVEEDIVVHLRNEEASIARRRITASKIISINQCMYSIVILTGECCAYFSSKMWASPKNWMQWNSFSIEIRQLSITTGGAESCCSPRDHVPLHFAGRLQFP